MQSEANQDQAAFWNDRAGHTWVELQDLLDRLFGAVADKVVDAGFPGIGGQVLDIGCGAGATTLTMAGRLGPGGECLGVDISRPLIEAAARRAADAGAAARFVVGDAQTYPFPAAGFDAAISRFGVMFFEDPVAAFQNIRAAVRPRGRLAFVAWRSPQENPFMTAAAEAAAAVLPDVPAPVRDGPGQFGFARAERMTDILAQAGWAEVNIRPLDMPGTLEAHDLDVYAANMGPAALRLHALDEAARAPIRQALRRAFDPYVHDGVARFDMACWLVTAIA
jgi:SAM-dependent methyltransferase